MLRNALKIGSFVAPAVAPAAASVAAPTVCPTTVRGRRSRGDRCDDVLSRYPDVTPSGMLRTMDYVGTGLFACTGCMTAAAVGMDVFGCSIVGATTALGGGTVRDIMLGNTPVSWVTEPEYLKLALGCAFGTFWFWKAFGDEGMPLSQHQEDIIFWLDSMGLGAFAVIGVQNAVRRGLGTPHAVLCGVMTATFGGLIRDILCNKPVRILNTHDETYAAAPMLASLSYLAARSTGAPLASRIAVAYANPIPPVYLRHTHTHTGSPLPSFCATSL